MRSNITINVVRRNGKWIAITGDGMITASTCRLLMDELVEYVTAHDRRGLELTEVKKGGAKT